MHQRAHRGRLGPRPLRSTAEDRGSLLEAVHRLGPEWNPGGRFTYPAPGVARTSNEPPFPVRQSTTNAYVGYPDGFIDQDCRNAHTA